MRSKKRYGKRTMRRSGRKSCKSSYSRQQSGGAMCLTGACGAGAMKIGSLVMGSLGTYGSYKILSKKKNGRTSKNVHRSQKFKYEDSNGKTVNFSIKQKNKKVDIITHKQGKKSEKKKNYKTIQQATNAYNKKIRECIKKGFNKC